MPFSIESILLDQNNVAIYLVFVFIINILERVSTKLFFLSFKFRRVSFKVILTIPYYLLVIFNFIRTIALLAFSTIYMIGKDSISLLPTILALRNTRVHIGSLDSSNMLFYIEISVNKTLSLCTILRVPNVNPYNS